MFSESDPAFAATILVAALAFEGLAVFLIVRSARSMPKDAPNRARKLVVRTLFATALALLFVSSYLPTTRLETRPAPLDVVVDDSASMTRVLDDGDDVRARAETLLDALKTRCERRRRPLETRFLSGKTTFSAAFASPLDDLEERRDSRNSGAYLLLTDGIANPPDAAPRPDVRPDVRRVVLGSSRPARNWRVDDLTITRPAAVEATLELVHADAPRRAVVELWRKESDASPARVYSEKVAIDALDTDGSGKARFRHALDVENASGTWLLAVVDESDVADFSPESLLPNAPDAVRPKEICLADNAQTFSFDDAETKTRVLLVDDLPRWEYRYLRETLRREPTVELKTLLLSADPEVVKADPIAITPETLDRRALAQFDVVIVGDLTREQFQDVLPAIPDVATREDSTTSLWFAGAERLARDPRWLELPEAKLAPGTPVAPASPTDEIDVAWQIAPSPLGARIWTKLDPDNLPELTHLFAAVVPNAGAAPLLVAKKKGGSEEEPLVIAQSLGKNAILWQATDEMWRLQTLDDKSVYRSFVLQTLDYLTSPNRPKSDGDSVDPLETLEKDDVFDYFAPENARRLAALRELENVAADAKDAALDLRDLSQEESLKRFDAFLSDLDSTLPDETTPVKRPIIPLNLAFPLVIALFLLTIFL